MITLFVALYSLLCLCTAVNTSDIKELHVKTVKLGEDVTLECNISGVKNKNNLAWYKQSSGKLPQFVSRVYGNQTKVAEGLDSSRFSLTANDHKFVLNIIKTREDDGGEYFCGEVDGNVLKFISGTHLQFEGKEMKLCSTPNKTLNNNSDCVTHQGSNSSHVKENEIWIIALTTSVIISVIAIAVLVGVFFLNQRKGASSSSHQIPTNQADDEDVLNYAAVSFAKKPSSSRTSRDKSHQDIYAEVQTK